VKLGFGHEKSRPFRRRPEAWFEERAAFIMVLFPANGRKETGERLLGRQALTALGAATRDDLLAVLGGHTRAVAVTAGSHELRRLECPLHEVAPNIIVGREMTVKRRIRE
jgi:hypothetical protein